MAFVVVFLGGRVLLTNVRVWTGESANKVVTLTVGTGIFISVQVINTDSKGPVLSARAAGTIQTRYRCPGTRGN